MILDDGRDPSAFNPNRDRLVQRKGYRLPLHLYHSGAFINLFAASSFDRVTIMIASVTHPNEIMFPPLFVPTR